MAVTANGITQSQETRSPDSVQLYSRYLSKRCPEVYKVDKIYVGRLKEVPPPSPVQGKWDKEVRPDLERHLCQATNMMSKSMPDEEVITEPVLCMAGKKCSPMSVPLKSGATCPKDPVALNPTIWIYCGGRKCKKQVSKSIRNLTYLHHFLNRFGMGAPHISLYAPWPAVREHSPGSPHHSHLNPASNVSFAIQQQLPGQETICGAKARFTIETSGENVECNSTIGGLVVVDDSIFAITSAHAIVNRLLENSHSVSSDETESLGNVSTDEDSEHEMSSSSDSSASGNNLCSHTTRTASIESPPSGSTGLGSVEERMWINTDLPSKLAYMTHGTINGDYSFPDQAPSASDFALVDVGPARLLLNGYYDPDRDTLATISDHIPVRELSQGDVWILTNCGKSPMKGYMLAGDSCVILRGSIMRTKKIQIAFVGDAHGMSGSWVVHEGSLCGVVYAAYDRSPYVHMLPADTMFQNIIELLQASVVRVANAQDIRERKVQMELRTLNLEGTDRTPDVEQKIDIAWYQEGAEQEQIMRMETCKQELGDEHPDTLASMETLASTYSKKGRWKEAKDLAESVISVRSRLRQKNLDLLPSRDILGYTSWSQGQWRKAELLYEELDAMCRDLLPMEHPSTLAITANFATSLMGREAFVHAENLYRSSIITSSKVLGPDHPDTLTIKANLATTYRIQGKWEEAEAFDVPVAESSSKVLGPEHPNTLTSMGNLALTYLNQGRLREAEELDGQVLEIRTRVLGPEHPDTLISMNNLAITLRAQGHDSKAVLLMEDCFELRSKVLGSEHPYTLSSLEALLRWKQQLAD